ncbi:MAG: hypothetical protein U0324_44220 [Polyangiales bacterium]
MSATFADTIAVGDVVRLEGAVESYAQVVERTARALVVRWHAHLYRAQGAAAGAGAWRCKAFEPWAVAPRKGRAA